MKKTMFWLVLIVGIVVLIGSCKKDDDKTTPPPTAALEVRDIPQSLRAVTLLMVVLLG